MKPLSTYVFVSEFAICSAASIKDFTCSTDRVESLDAIPGPQEEGSLWLVIAVSPFIYAFFLYPSVDLHPCGAWKGESILTPTIL